MKESVSYYFKGVGKISLFFLMQQLRFTVASISRYEGLRKYLDMSCYHLVQPKDELIQGPLIMVSPGLHLPCEGAWNLG